MNYSILSRLHMLIDVLAMLSAAAEKKKKKSDLES